jgi:Flp pilus assembly protein TadG
MRGERGSMTLWAMGMSLLLFAVGFLALDLWSGFAARQQAAAIADSAAIAGATALDEAAWRSGVLALHPSAAETRAVGAAVAHPAWDASMSVSAVATPGGVTVSVSRTIRFRFIAGLVPDRTADVTVTGYAEPEARP